MAPTSWPPRSVVDLLPALPPGLRLWLVGGAVRDALLGRPVLDLDFVVDGDALSVARHLADRLGAAFYPLDRERGTGRVIQPDSQRTLDFAALRAPTIEDDLRARDFTVNALAVRLDQLDRLLDPTGGLQDLKDRRLRACSERAVAEDPVRALRAVRLAAQLEFRMEPATLRQVSAAAQTLDSVAPERLRDEFFRMLDAPRPGRAVRLLDSIGLLLALLPELRSLRGLQQAPPHVLDAWEHTLAAVDRLGDLLAVLGPVHDEEASADLILGQAVLRLGRFRDGLSRHLARQLSTGRQARSLLFLAALYHDAGKPATGQMEEQGRMRFPTHEEWGAVLVGERARRLRLSAAEEARLTTVVRHHMRPAWLAVQPAVSNRAVYRFFRQVGEAGVEVVLLSLADFLATHIPPPPQEEWGRRLEVARALLEAHFEHPEQLIRPPALIRGDDLAAALGLSPGPLVGRLLEQIREAQASGEVTTQAQAIELARSILARHASSDEVDDQKEV